MLQCLEVVTGLALAFFAVFDGLGGAVADAGHAVGTLAAPYRPACCQADVVQWAALDALSASDAAVIRPERPGLDEEPVKDRVDRPAHKTVVQILAGGGKRLSGLDAVNGLLDSRGGAVHDAPGLGRVRGGEHGNIVLRHLDGGGTHGSQLLALCQLAVIVVGAADLAAAVHHKPDALCLGQRRGLQPLLYDPGDAPGVGGGSPARYPARSAPGRCPQPGCGHSGPALARRGPVRSGRRYTGCCRCRKNTVPSFLSFLGQIPGIQHGDAGLLQQRSKYPLAGDLAAGKAAVVDLLYAAAGAAGLQDGKVCFLFPCDLQGLGRSGPELPVYADAVPVDHLPGHDLGRAAGRGQSAQHLRADRDHPVSLYKVQNSRAVVAAAAVFAVLPQQAGAYQNGHGVTLSFLVAAGMVLPAGLGPLYCIPPGMYSSRTQRRPPPSKKGKGGAGEGLG